MKKISKVLAMILSFVIIMSTASFADEAYEQQIIDTYGLSETSVAFMREHNVDFSIFEGAPVYPDDHPINYNRDIESLIMQAEAYGFTDEQINTYIKGLLNTNHTIIGGPYDNTGRIRVTVPVHPLTVNGHGIDYEKSEYPIISYNDIMYFPMTWHYSRLLGLGTSWSAETGLAIDKCPAESEIPDYSGYDNTDEYIYAVIPEYDIYINGKKFDASSEEYPILNFRNVTYFPLTWDLIADEFGWDYSFDAENGLIIK